MQSTQRVYSDRILFFDNIRYLMILFVVVVHVACGYSHHTPWWPVNDENSKFFDYLVRYFDIIIIPVIFFIAGYFTLPSLYRKGTRHFIESKLKRLGIPWLIGVILLGPIRITIHEYSRDYQYRGLWENFLKYMKSALSFHTGFIDSVYQFSHIHLWFLPLLLFFFIVFALIYRSKHEQFKDAFFTKNPENHTKTSILFVLVVVGVCSAMSTLFMHGIFAKGQAREPWIIIANLIQFQPTKVGSYILCFSLGIYAFHKKWFINGKTPGHFVFWIILSIILWYFQERALANLMAGFTMQMAVIYVFARSFLFLSILLFLISFGGKYWESSFKVNRLIAENSFSIYLIHMIFVYLIQLWLFKWLSVTIYIKFVFGCILSLSLSYVFSQYVIKKYPRTSMVGMVCLFALLSVFMGSG